MTLRFRFFARLLSFGAFACGATACGGSVDSTDRQSTVPVVPVLTSSRATVSGQVVNQAGSPIAGATLQLHDRGESSTSGADGKYSLDVPAESDITVTAYSMDNAPTRAAQMHPAVASTTMGLDLTVLTQEKLDHLNALGGAGSDRGVIAVTVTSMGGGCTAAGGAIKVDPAAHSHVVYVSKATGEPDPALTSIEAGAVPSAYVVGLLPPSSYSTVALEKSGCTAASYPVTHNGAVYSGRFSVMAGGLTQLPLFTE